MARSIPIVREVRWLAVVAQLIVLALLILLAAAAFGSESAVMVGASAFLAYSLLSRRFIPYHHRRGIRLMRASQWPEAVSHFRQSYEFFSNYSWIDRFRWLLLLSPSAASYREMALLNEAFALGQQGKRPEARSTYQRVLHEFPDSVMAQSALNLMEPVA